MDAYVSPLLRRLVDRASREQGVGISELVRDGLHRALEARGYVPLGARVPDEMVGKMEGLEATAVMDALRRDGYREQKK